MGLSCSGDHPGVYTGQWRISREVTLRLDYSRFLLLLVFLPAPSLVACDPVPVWPEGDRRADLVLSLANLIDGEDSGENHLGEIRGLRVRLDAGHETDDPRAPVYDSGCSEYSGDRLRISSLEIRDDYRIRIDLFKDPACEELAFRGVRGGMKVSEKRDEGAPYLIAMLATNAFTGLPGVAGEHYPLNSVRRRAFHTATAIGDGRLVLLGGAEGVRSSDFIGGEGAPEIFDTRTMLFSRSTRHELASRRLMAHATAWLPGGLLAVGGGVQAFRLGKDTAGRVELQIPSEICYGDSCDTVNYILDFSFLDLHEHIELEYPLASARVFPTLDVVRLSAGDTLILVGGEPGVFDTAAGSAFACSVVEGLAPKCDPLPLAYSRAGHTSACIRRTADGACTSLALLGGVEPGHRLVEWIALGQQTAHDHFIAAVVDNSRLDSSLLLPRAVGHDGHIFMTGGALGRIPTAERRAGPAAITLSEAGTGFFRFLDMDQELGPDAGELLFHTVTLLADDRVLLAGGVGPDNDSRDEAFVLRHEGSTYVVDQSLRLKQARFGHTATRVEGGPLDGAVVIFGGVDFDAEGRPHMVETAEIFLPE